MNIKKDRDILDIAQLVVTIVTALVAVRLNFQQSELSRRVQREGITQTYADKILGYVLKLDMPPRERDAIVIDMLEIITEANLNTGEQPFSDTERQQLIPLRLALATHDADLIAHIGTSSDKRNMWTTTAIHSGNDEIKRTAIRALAQIGRYRARETELDTFKFCVEKILDISDDFARAPISEDAITQFNKLVEVAEKVPSLFDDPALKALMDRGHTALVLVTGRAIQECAEEKVTPPEPAPAPTPAGPKPTALRGAVVDENGEGVRRVLYRESSPAFIAQIAGGSKTLRLASAFNAAQKALKQMQSLNLKKEGITRLSPQPSDLSATITELEDNDVAIRRKARQELVKGGAVTIPLLLEALRRKSDNYRIKVGITFALAKMSDAGTITKGEDAQLLVNLTGDSEPEIRQYASEFLMRLSDSASIRLCLAELLTTINRERTATPPNGNAVYNAVVILGTWMRTLPSALGAEKNEIATYLRNLEPQLARDDSNWGKTRALIGELNVLGPESTPVQN
jgi:hypothetical protein